MYNKYTIEVFEEEYQVKAVVYLGKDCLGKIWSPNSKISDKNQYKDLFESVGQIIYGQENKVKKEIESYCTLLETIETKNKAKQD